MTHRQKSAKAKELKTAVEYLHEHNLAHKVIEALVKRKAQFPGEDPSDSPYIRWVIEAAMAEERKECAKLADRYDKAIGKLIRARKKKFS